MGIIRPVSQWWGKAILRHILQFPHEKTEVLKVDAFAKGLKVVRCLAQKATHRYLLYVIVTFGTGGFFFFF